MIVILYLITLSTTSSHNHKFWCYITISRRPHREGHELTKHFAVVIARLCIEGSKEINSQTIIEMTLINVYKNSIVVELLVIKTGLVETAPLHMPYLLF